MTEALVPTMREKVKRAEEVMRQYGDAVEIPVRHHFANAGTKRGVYAREVTIPAGTMATGKIHKFEQISILSKGDISVSTEDGIVRVQAPFTIVSPAGTKRIVYAHTDCVWTTIHATELTDLEAIEDQFIAQTEQDYLDFTRAIENKGAACLG
jgi:quercetin dioxygenase-like cupin family protein